MGCCGGGSAGGGGGRPPVSSDFNQVAQAPTPPQAKKLYKNSARNVSVKTYTSPSSNGSIGVTQYSPPSRGGAGKFYQKTIDKAGKTSFWDKWTKGSR